MKKNCHPKVSIVRFYCTCGHEVLVESTLKKDSMEIDICSKCHPFYTGKQKLVDTAGRVERFMGRYQGK